MLGQQSRQPGVLFAQLLVLLGDPADRERPEKRTGRRAQLDGKRATPTQ